MCCGGSMEVAITPAGPSRDAIAQLAGTRGAPRVTEISAAEQRSAGLILVTPLDGGPLALRPPREGDPRAHAPVVDGDALVERVGAAERAIVFGLGHVARTVGPLLDQLGFAVIACDDGETGAAEDRPAWASELIHSFDASAVEQRLGGFGADDYVLIVTRDHAIDQQLLEQLIGHPQLGYLGMIGSRGKIGRFKKRLEAKGLYDDATWARLRAPIGLDLGAETPEEIAIAIAAELVARRRRGVAAAGEWR
jgi:xanthine dehydrogenase accessory factor